MVVRRSVSRRVPLEVGAIRGVFPGRRRQCHANHGTAAFSERRSIGCDWWMAYRTLCVSRAPSLATGTCRQVSPARRFCGFMGGLLLGLNSSKLRELRPTRLQFVQCAPVAQMDRATGYEPVGRAFESLRAHHPLLRHADSQNSNATQLQARRTASRWAGQRSPDA